LRNGRKQTSKKTPNETKGENQRKKTTKTETRRRRAKKANEEKVEVIEKKEAEPPGPATGGGPSPNNVANAADYDGPFYGYNPLKSKGLDNEIDRTRREMYLSPDEFQKVFGMTKPAFYAAPAWRQKKLKQDKALF